MDYIQFLVMTHLLLHDWGYKLLRISHQSLWGIFLQHDAHSFDTYRVSHIIRNVLYSFFAKKLQRALHSRDVLYFFRWIC